MNRKTLRTLLAVLVALGLWVLVVERPWQDDIRRPARDSGRLFPKFDPADARTVTIETPAGATRLERDGDAWIVADADRFRADTKAVQEMLARVDTMETATVASTNPDKRATFGVDSSGVGVTIADAGGRDLVRFRVGNSTPDFSGLFVRPEDADAVYAVPGLNRFHFDRGQQTWRDKAVVPIAAEEVRRVTVAWGDTTVSVSRVGDDSLDVAAWTVAGNRPGETEAPALAVPARTLARGVAGLVADAFPTAQDTVPAEWTLAWTLEVESRSGERVVVEVGPKLARGQHVVRRAGDREVYLVGPWRFTRFQKRWDELRDPAAAAAATPAADTPAAP
jgi:hypothetical protein